MPYQVEHTDTFSGEANYCWVRRYHCAADLSPRQLVRMAKAACGLTGHPCVVTRYGDMTAIRPRRICQVIFITWEEKEYVQGQAVDHNGAPL